MKKSIKIILIIIGIIALFIIGLFVFYFTSKNNGNSKNKDKITYQIKYLDSKLTYCLNTITSETSEPNNQELINNIKEIYEYWNNMILDLSLDQNIEKSTINDFGQSLNSSLIAINNLNNQDIQQSLINLYERLINIYEQEENDANYKDIIITKYNLMNSYILVKRGNWIEADKFIKKAVEAITQIFNESDEDNLYNINLAYISIKELENVIAMQNYEIFYIKYKIALENLNKI